MFKVGGDYNALQAFVAEVMFTAAIVITAHFVGEHKDSNIVASLSIPASVFAGIKTVGGVSGACFNPAIGIGLNSVHAIH